MKIKILLLSILLITQYSCIDNAVVHTCKENLKKAQKGIERCYSVKGIFDHFPKSYSSKSYIHMQSSVPSTEFDPQTYQGIYSANSYLFLDMGADSKRLIPESYIYKTRYSNRNFFIDDSFSYYKYYDTLKLRNVALLGAYPIPYFMDFDFGLGSERFDLRKIGIQLVCDKYNVPDDLEVYVLKAESGNFWKLKVNQERPEELGDWKNGYSCGLAISIKHNKIIYWMIAW